MTATMHRSNDGVRCSKDDISCNVKVQRGLCMARGKKVDSSGWGLSPHLGPPP